MSKTAPISDAWYSVEGPDNDVVLSTRIRLARNLVDFPFPQQFKSDDGDKVQGLIFDAFSKVDENESYQSLLVSELDSLGQKILVERGVIESDSVTQPSSGLILRGDGKVSCTVNCIDHLRLSSFSTGLDIVGPYNLVHEMDEKLQHHLQFAGSVDFGYLNAGLKDLGTGMKISLLVHLPSVSKAGILDRVFKDVMSGGFDITGYYGTGFGAGTSLGSFYKISTSSSFSDDEETQMNRIYQLGKRLVDFERKTREEFIKNKPTFIRDSVYKALAMVKYSRFLENREAVDFISRIKWGLDLGLLTGIDESLLFALLYRIKTSHLSYVINSSSLSYEKDVNTDELKTNRLRSLILQESLSTIQIVA